MLSLFTRNGLIKPENVRYAIDQTGYFRISRVAVFEAFRKSVFCGCDASGRFGLGLPPVKIQILDSKKRIFTYKSKI